MIIATDSETNVLLPVAQTANSIPFLVGFPFETMQEMLTTNHST